MARKKSRRSFGTDYPRNYLHAVTVVPQLLSATMTAHQKPALIDPQHHTQDALSRHNCDIFPSGTSASTILLQPSHTLLAYLQVAIRSTTRRLSLLTAFVSLPTLGSMEAWLGVRLSHIES